MFKVKFRGVRGSYPVADANFLKYGGNTACVEVNVGGHLIILDAGTGMIKIGDELMERHIASGFTPEERTPITATVLLTHIHQDHLQGFTFFGPLHLKSTKINVFGNVVGDLSEELSKILFGKSFPLDLNDIIGNLNITNITDETIILRQGCEPILARLSDNITPQFDDVVIQHYKSYAHPKDGVTIYKISYQNRSLVYATDKESYLGGDKKLINFAKNCNLLIHDAQYTTEDYLNPYSPKQGYGHSTFEMALEAKRLTNAERLVFFHFDPSYNDEKLDSLDFDGIKAQEGMEFDV